MLCLYNNCCFLKSCKVKHFFSFSMLFILNLLFEKYHKTDKFKKKQNSFVKHMHLIIKVLYLHSVFELKIL